MRDYYYALGLNRESAVEQVRSAVETLSTEQLADEGDLQSVMENDQWRTHYDRVNLQYEAIAAVMSSADFQGIETSHSWDKRVVEFMPEQDTIEFE